MPTICIVLQKESTLKMSEDSEVDQNKTHWTTTEQNIDYFQIQTHVVQIFH